MDAPEQQHCLPPVLYIGFKDFDHGCKLQSILLL
jgi:hypothetical protein